jgi:hypothetical protein
LRSLNLARSPDVPSTTFPQGLGEVEADILTGSQPDGIGTLQRGQGSPSPGITIGFRLFMSR